MKKAAIIGAGLGGLTFGAYLARDGYEVTVFDNGIGISKQAQNHIFDKFYQEDKARGKSGNGLGLALVKRIVTLCSGEIKLESEIGKGSSFTVFLPFEFNE